MHHCKIRHLFRQGSRLSEQYSEMLSYQTSVRIRGGFRLFCSKKDVNEGTSQEGSETGVSEKRNERKLTAKAKLDSLLLSIVKESKEAAEKLANEPKIDFKLAAPLREKKPVAPEEIQTAAEKEAEEDLGKEMVQAVKKVAEVVQGEGDAIAVESELVQKLKNQVGKKINLSDLMAGMKIDHSSKNEPPSSVNMELSRAHRVRRLLDERTRESSRVRDFKHETGPRQRQQRRTPQSQPTYVPINLFGSEPLGIFTAKSPEDKKDTSQSQAPKLKTWDMLYAKDLKLAVTHPPANGFEEMILWTEQKKMWRFPINNEQDLDEEAKVPFHDHVFLDHKIEPWCPKKGPIRHFMELVCVGLSKNPFLTVVEKHEHIEWYHQYFKNKAAIIKEVGAGEIK